tara:strand:+ start:845 stop:1486 length:642 start_codon:yes stop_codon:yes gene_type:complete
MKKDNKSILQIAKDYFSNTPELKDLEVIEKSEVVESVKEKFEDVTLLDGNVVSVEPALEVGANITAIAEDETMVLLPIGEYELEDGSIIVVEVEGIIAEIKPIATEEQEVPVDGEEEMGNDKTVEADQKVRKVIESIVKESVFELTEKLNKFEKENEFLHKENDAIKELFAELKENTGVALKEVFETPSKEPIKSKVNVFSKKEETNIFIKKR